MGFGEAKAPWYPCMLVSVMGQPVGPEGDQRSGVGVHPSGPQVVTTAFRVLMPPFASVITQHNGAACDLSQLGFTSHVLSLSASLLRAQRSFLRWATWGKGVGFSAGADVP